MGSTKQIIIIISDDNLPLNKILKFHTITVTIRYKIREDNKLYPQVFLDETLHSL